MANTNAWSNALAAANTATRTTNRKKKVQNIEHAERVLFCLDLSNPVRRLCIRVAEWKSVLFFYIFATSNKNNLFYSILFKTF